MTAGYLTSSSKLFVTIPWYVWVLDWLGVAFFAFMSFVFITQLYETHVLAAYMGLCLLGLTFVITAVRNVANHMKVSGIAIDENGLHKAGWPQSAYLRWEDVSRFDEPSKGCFVLSFRNGQKIRIPAQVKGFEEIKRYCLESLEKLGTFVDGRKVPRVLWSFSFRRR